MFSFISDVLPPKVEVPAPHQDGGHGSPGSREELEAEEATLAPPPWSPMSRKGQQAFFKLAALRFHHLMDEFRRW